MKDTMYALVKSQPGKGLSLEKVPVPTMTSNDVMIHIRKTSICGTDLHIYNWDQWSQKTIKTPMTIGHEFVGEIVKIGENVRGFQKGQLVSGEGHVVCGVCRNCRAGKRHLCRNTQGIGVNRDGAFAEYLVIPASNVVVVGPGISEDLCSSFDPLGNAVHTALTYDLVGEDVLITGAGPIGIMAAAVCRHCGARHVVITDLNEYRLNLAGEIAERIRPVNVAKESLDDVMRELDMKEGFDVGLEMSGSGTAFSMMIDHMENGGNIALLGIHNSQPDLDWNKVVFNGLNIKGIYGRKIFETWYKMMSMLNSGLNLDKIITHRFDFKDFEKGFEVMNTGKSGKVVLDWTTAW
jgi:threonine 3-dehydrogenase